MTGTMARWLGRRRAVAALCLVPLLAGCWLQVGQGPAHRRYNPDETALTRANVATLHQAWSTAAAGAFSEPIVSGNRVYASWAVPSGSADGYLRALDVGSGATVWETRFASIAGRFLTNVVPAVLAGDQLWTGASSSTFLSPPACIAADARVSSADGSVVSSTIGQDAHSAAVPAGDAVVRTRQGCNGGSLVLEVLDADTAAERWTAALPSAAISANLPTVADDRILVADASQLYAFPLAGCSAATCDPEWTSDLGARIDPQEPVGGFGGQAFVTSSTADGSEVIAVDAATGAELWRAPAGTAVTGLAVTEDTVFVAADDGLRAFAAAGCGTATCAPVWKAALGTAARGAPVTAGGVVYVGTDGAVLAFDAAGCAAVTCDALASVPVTGRVSSLSVDQGRLFVSSAVTTGSVPFITVEGHLTAFAPS